MCVLFLSREGLSFIPISLPASCLRLPEQRFVKRSSALSMNLVNRFMKVVTSNVNSIISSLEDPEKILDQAVEDMQKDLIKIRQSYAEISATQKRSVKQKETADSLAADWYKRAQLALEKGDEELAKEALSRRQIQLEVSQSTETNIRMQEDAIDKLYTSMMTLQEKIESAKREKDIMIARAKTAKTSVKVNDMINEVSGESSMAAFEKMKAKVEGLEAQAEVAGELAASSSSGSSASLEDRFKALESDSDVDRELEALKRQLPAAEQEVAGELPPPSDAAIDEEYERLKRELGQR